MGKRCEWCGDDPLYIQYHDEEWGVPLHDRLSKDLKKRGFGFVGSTICYAFMQATGMVNDHVTHCPQYRST